MISIVLIKYTRKGCYVNGLFSLQLYTVVEVTLHAINLISSTEPAHSINNELISCVGYFQIQCRCYGRPSGWRQYSNLIGRQLTITFESKRCNATLKETVKSVTVELSLWIEAVKLR